jgi:phospholipid/cholesterol/gamma-HCH transport system permease protein
MSPATAPSAVPIALPATLDAAAERGLHRAALQAARAGRVVLDGARLDAVDALATARLLRVVADVRATGAEVALERPSESLRRALADLDAGLLDEDRPAPHRPALEAIGAAALHGLDATRSAAGLAHETVAGLSRPFGRGGIKWDRTFEQISLAGAGGVPIVVFVSFLVGVVLALNGAQQLRQFGAAIFIANLVAISITREMGPLITAIIVSGRSGSAIAAEIGTMVISEEVDAMRAMALAPVRFLVVPKVLALVLALPLLTVLSNTAGIAGGYLVGVFVLDLGANAYATQTVQALLVSDVVTGLVKSVVFAVLIGLIGAQRGFAVRGGPEAVGRATTSAVVTAIIACIVANAGFTAFFYYTG